MELTRGEKEFLLKIARVTLEYHLWRGERYEPQTVNQKLWSKRGVFATLFKNKILRGCVGTVEAQEPLLLAVRDSALAVARDPRFLPLEKEELADTTIEISILSQPEPVKLSEIKIGDGVVLRQKDKSATYLPAVWSELGEIEAFLSSLSEKAGLPRDAYQNSRTEFWRYEAEAFKEGEI